MRSYFEHLETLAPKKSALTPRPIFRSSAIFPVIQEKGISTRLIFLGYWLLKRRIGKIEAVITLRSLEGSPLARKVMSIVEAKAYTLELEEMLHLGGVREEKDFFGSLEIEYYATDNLVFPYPAVAINFYGENYSSVVHVAQRVYNDYEDMRANSQTAVPESGFNIYADEQHEPFIGLINGAMQEDDAKIEFEFYNREGKVLRYTEELGTLAPYQTSFLFPGEKIDLKAFLHNEPGACKAKFHVNWIFPRLLVGNLQKPATALAITHTYYDCSAAETNRDYWPEAEAGWHAASLMVPVWLEGDRFTNVYFYPIYSPSYFAIDLEIYNREGKLLLRKEQALEITAPGGGYVRLDFKKLLQEWGLDARRNCAVRLIARPLGGSRLPARIKLGLDHGHVGRGLPCNICTNLQPFSPQLESKPSSFKWLPILGDQKSASIWLMNSSPKMEYVKTATLEVTFFRESDTEQLKRTIKLPAQGFTVINPEDDLELQQFLQGRIGWATVITDNAYLTTFYYADAASGCIGGDHGF